MTKGRLLTSPMNNKLNEIYEMAQSCLQKNNGNKCECSEDDLCLNCQQIRLIQDFVSFMDSKNGEYE
jgi:hypothetical protein